MFADRIDAGRRLAAALAGRLDADTVVLGLPRGGVPVAAEVAGTHGLDLDVIIVRKLGLPGQPELAMGAIGEHGVRVLNDTVIERSGARRSAVADVERMERIELERRAEIYRAGRPPVGIGGRPVVIVDDGIATGATAAAACEVARSGGATYIRLAVPVGPSDAFHRFHDAADDVVIVDAPAGFHSVGQFYVDFRATSDSEVTACLDRRPRHRPM